MQRHLASLAVLAALAGLAACPVAIAAEPGVQSLQMKVAHRDRPLDVQLFFPAEADGRLVDVGANPLFVGEPMREGATPEPGRHALVLMSHGSGGNAPNLAWLGAALAREGFVVVAPNHPGTTSGDSRPADTMRIWERPADLSRLLDAVLADASLSRMVDPSNVSVAGFSLGGFTALASVGVRMNAADYANYCDRDWPERPLISECNWLKKAVDLRRLDARFEGDMRDPRFIRAVAIDPGLAHAATPESLSSVSVPVTVISLGSQGRVPPAVATERLMANLPHATQHYVAGAVHFSFLGECRPNGHAILAAEQELDPICDDDGRARAEIHAEIARFVVEGLRR
jgi:predicted dienelactone hydrolase